MKAITIRPPWSACIADPLFGPGKLVENRSRTTSHRGPIAIHAGLTLDKAGLKDWRVRMSLWGFKADLDPSAVGFLALGLTTGAVLAVADLVDCHQAVPNPSRSEPGEYCCWPWGDRLSGARPAHHLVLANVRRLAEPVPCAGQIMVPWTLRDEVAAEVDRLLAAVVA